MEDFMINGMYIPYGYINGEPYIAIDVVCKALKIDFEKADDHLENSFAANDYGLCDFGENLHPAFRSNILWVGLGCTMPMQ